jgi:structural maintenance of chromosome 2
MGQLAEAKARAAAAGTEAEQAKMKIGLAEKEIKEKEPRAKKAEKEGEGLIREFTTKKADVERLSKKLEGSGWDEVKERELLSKQAEHSQRMNELLEVSYSIWRVSHR